MVNIRVEGGKGAADRRRRLAVIYSDLTEPLTQIGVLVREHIAEGFSAQGSPAPWAPLSNRAPFFYRRWKEKHAPGKPILQLTGALKRAALAEAGPNEEGNVSVIGKTSARFGVKLSQPVTGFEGESTTLSYAADHQLGLGVPARPWLQMTDKLKKDASATLRAWIINKAKVTK